MENVWNIKYNKLSQLNFCFWRSISSAQAKTLTELLLCQCPLAQPFEIFSCHNAISL